MEKRTLYALMIFVVVGLGAFFVMRAPEKGLRQGPRPRPIEAMKAADLQQLEITTDKNEKTTLEKSGTVWRVKSPSDWPADASAVKTLTDGLEKMTFGDLVTESKEKHEEMGVADGKATHVVAKGAGGKTLVDLYVGKSVGSFIMVRPGQKTEVWQSAGLQPFAVNKDAKGWRDHAVVDFAAADADKLTVEGGGSSLSLEKLPAEKDAKPGEPAKWKIASATGSAPKTGAALDESMVNGTVQAIATLRATDFADDKPATETALGTPNVKLTIDAKGKSYVVSIGAQKGDDVYVQTAGNPTIYVVKKYGIDRANHRPIDYRDKTLTKVKALDLQSVDLTTAGETVTLTRAGDKWKSQKPIDDNKAKSVVSAFENLQGGGFAEEKDPAKLGLAKPTGTVVLHLADKSSVTLKIGALDKDGADYFVQRVGMPEVMTMKKYAVDRFLRKAADLAPAPPGKTASAMPRKK